LHAAIYFTRLLVQLCRQGIKGVDKHPPCKLLCWWKRFIPRCSSPTQLQRLLPLQSSSQLFSLTGTKTTSAKTNKISTDLPLHTVRKI